MADSTRNSVVRLEFDRERKLKPKHKYLREAVRQSGRSITELLNDPFNGYPWLLQALLTPSAQTNETITLDKCSEFIDIYCDKHGSIVGLSQGLTKCVMSYMGIEAQPTADEAAADSPPNEDSP